MQFFNLMVLALAGTALAAKDPNSAKCRQMARLERLEKLAGDDNRLNQRFKNNGTRVADFKKKVNDNKNTLAELKKDTNLVNACAQKKVELKSTFDCYRMMGMQRLEKVVNNQTRLDRVTKNDKTRAEALKKKVNDNKDKLNKLQSNSTLTQFCAGVQTKRQCGRMNRLSKKVERDQKMVNDQGALDNRFKKDATRINLFKARAARDQQKLNEMKGNQTLASACNTIATQKKATAPNANEKKSAATASAQSMGVSVALLAVAVAGLMSL
ncbi:hypothetical protein GGTG_04437 [Gaeumannomyces tritici R3-111a-1]|uniref:Uncharacterized protein n=1 Tax=Gaeumannomyces tritici (strain R3-111a-1) TaxID=644352 RepID=J3NT38_GAET3|nr:hypothetical protein GGTG_04437 [Gaeumannomyces tritici R3-111a-1]EJT79353.1 hypothetical protein GGTG_04437 [Gaeumannomyces tritici R3-111a-1]